VKSGPVCVITGAARGIGKRVAENLAAKGARVVIFDLQSAAETGEATAKAIRESGGNCLFCSGSVCNEEEVHALFERTVAEWGRVDVLVNNAGITRDGILLRMKQSAWKAVIDVNLTGTFNCSKEAIRLFSKQRKGRIVNISSVVGLVGNAGQVNYAASKAGIIGLTKSLAKEYGHRGVLVNTVAPGFIKSDMTAVLSEKIQAKIMKDIPLGRMGSVEEVAGVVAFLALDPVAGYISGQSIVVDGGMTCV